MAKKNRYQFEKDNDEEEVFVSRSQKKRDSSALQKIGEELACLAPAKLAKLPLTEDLKEAFAEFRKLSDKEAKRRHLQYIGRLMREAQLESELSGGEDIVAAYLEMKSEM